MVRAEFPNISLATVYRNLSEMYDEGNAVMLTTVSGSVHFDADTSPHSHLYCNKCGGVTDVYPDLPDLRKAAEDKGYEVTNYSLMYSGVCENCRK